MTTETEFDPYHKWLGIPKSEQPPNHYRLLGIALFESDVEVIDAAANQRMSYLQEVAVGPHMDLSQKLLNEIAAARRCLLDPKKKAEYDARLREELQKRERGTRAATATEAPGATAPPRTPQAIGETVPAKRARQKRVQKRSAVAAGEEPVAEAEPGAADELRRRNMLITAGVSAVSIVIAIAIYVFSRGDAGAGGTQGKAVLVVDWPLEQRKNGRVELDGRSVKLPETNPAEILVSPGAHKIVFERLGYRDIKFEAKFLPGERIPVRLNWRRLPPAQDTSDIEWKLPGQSEKANGKRSGAAAKPGARPSGSPGGTKKGGRKGSAKSGGKGGQKTGAKKPGSRGAGGTGTGKPEAAAPTRSSRKKLSASASDAPRQVSGGVDRQPASLARCFDRTLAPLRTC